MLDQKFLSIYLNDHLAGSVTGIELARRTLSSNRGTREEQLRRLDEHRTLASREALAA